MIKTYINNTDMNFLRRNLQIMEYPYILETIDMLNSQIPRNISATNKPKEIIGIATGGVVYLAKATEPGANYLMIGEYNEIRGRLRHSIEQNEIERDRVKLDGLDDHKREIKSLQEIIDHEVRQLKRLERLKSKMDKKS